MYEINIQIEAEAECQWQIHQPEKWVDKNRVTWDVSLLHNLAMTSDDTTNHTTSSEYSSNHSVFTIGMLPPDNWSVLICCVM